MNVLFSNMFLYKYMKKWAVIGYCNTIGYRLWNSWILKITTTKDLKYSDFCIILTVCWKSRTHFEKGFNFLLDGKISNVLMAKLILYPLSVLIPFTGYIFLLAFDPGISAWRICTPQKWKWESSWNYFKVLGMIFMRFAIRYTKA